MGEYRLEITLDRDGSLSLSDLPFRSGDVVEVIVQSRSQQGSFGSPVHIPVASVRLRATVCW